MSSVHPEKALKVSGCQSPADIVTVLWGYQESVTCALCAGFETSGQYGLPFQERKKDVARNLTMQRFYFKFSCLENLVMKNSSLIAV